MDVTSEMLKHARVGPVDHLGIAVLDLEKAKAFYGEMLGLPLLFEETVETEKVRVAAYHAGGVRVELLASTDPDGPIGRYVAKRGPGLHHVCYQVPDIRKTLEELERRGVKPIPPAPRPGAHACTVAFLHPKDTGGILLELSQPPFGGVHTPAPAAGDEEEA